MSWERVKTVLIFLFLAINIFLVSFMLMSISQTTEIDRTTVLGTVNVLKAGGVTVDADIVPTSIPKYDNADVYNIALDEKFKNAAGDSLKVADSEFELFYKYDVSGINEENIDKAVKGILKDLTIDTKNVVIFHSGQGDKLYAKARYQEDGMKFYEPYISFYKGDGGFNIKGYWFTPKTEIKKSNARGQDMAYITSILVDFMSNADREITKASVISGIDIGYSVQNYDTGSVHMSVPAVPAVKLKLQSGEEYYYNARTGEYLYFTK